MGKLKRITFDCQSSTLEVVERTPDRRRTPHEHLEISMSNMVHRSVTIVDDGHE